MVFQSRSVSVAGLRGGCKKTSASLHKYRLVRRWKAFEIFAVIRFFILIKYPTECPRFLGAVRWVTRSCQFMLSESFHATSFTHYQLLCLLWGWSGEQHWILESPEIGHMTLDSASQSRAVFFQGQRSDRQSTKPRGSWKSVNSLTPEGAFMPCSWIRSPRWCNM